LAGELPAYFPKKSRYKPVSLAIDSEGSNFVFFFFPLEAGACICIFRLVRGGLLDFDANDPTPDL